MESISNYKTNIKYKINFKKAKNNNKYMFLDNNPFNIPSWCIFYKTKLIKGMIQKIQFSEMINKVSNTNNFGFLLTLSKQEKISKFIQFLQMNRLKEERDQLNNSMTGNRPSLTNIFYPIDYIHSFTFAYSLPKNKSLYDWDNIIPINEKLYKPINLLLFD